MFFIVAFDSVVDVCQRSRKRVANSHAQGNWESSVNDRNGLMRNKFS